MTKSGSGSCTPWTWRGQWLDRARSIESRLPGTQGSWIGEDLPAEWGDRETHPKTSTSGSYHSNQEETKPTLRKQDPASRDLGSRDKKNETFLNLNAFRRVKAVTTGGTENGLKKEERHDRYDSAYNQARKEPLPSHNLQENSQARFFQLDPTTARRYQPVKRRSVLWQALRGRGKRRPAQARWNPTQRKV